MAAPVILVTGSTDGIGRAAARDLAFQGAEVIIHGRDENKGKRVLAEIKETTGSTKLSLLTADLSEQRNVRLLAHDIISGYSRLDVLVNNAGTCEHARILTPDGIETTFAVNYLAPFLLTRLLLPLLEVSAPSRVVNVSSVSHNFIKTIDWENLQGEKNYTIYGNYALTKFANITFTYSLSERITGNGVTANCLNPGVISTKLLKRIFPSLIGLPVSEGARLLAHLALSPELEGETGKYFNERGQPALSSGLTYDQAVRERLWRVAENMTGVRWGAGTGKKR
jgi:NAD(P)-dependent dehydrogenase (short-subunit alcohol dehydrogenase family)